MNRNARLTPLERKRAIRVDGLPEGPDVRHPDRAIQRDRFHRGAWRSRRRTSRSMSSVGSGDHYHRSSGTGGSARPLSAFCRVPCLCQSGPIASRQCGRGRPVPRKYRARARRATCVMIILITPISMPSVTGPAPFLARLRPYSISIARSIWPMRSLPRSFFIVARVAALLLRGGIPTAHMSSICKSMRSPNVARRAADTLVGHRP